jgi:hypothetical protein
MRKRSSESGPGRGNPSPTVQAASNSAGGAVPPLEVHAGGEIRKVEGRPCPQAATGLLASREKNHTPDIPSRCTYVLKFSSCDSLR